MEKNREVKIMDQMLDNKIRAEIISKEIDRQTNISYTGKSFAKSRVPITAEMTKVLKADASGVHFDMPEAVLDNLFQLSEIFNFNKELELVMNRGYIEYKPVVGAVKAKLNKQIKMKDIMKDNINFIECGISNPYQLLTDYLIVQKIQQAWLEDFIPKADRDKIKVETYITTSNMTDTGANNKSLDDFYGMNTEYMVEGEMTNLRHKYGNATEIATVIRVLPQYKNDFDKKVIQEIVEYSNGFEDGKAVQYYNCINNVSLHNDKKTYNLLAINYTFSC